MKKLFKKLESPAFIVPGNWFLRLASLFVIVMGLWGVIAHFTEGGFRNISWGFVELAGVLLAAAVALCSWQELVVEIRSKKNHEKKSSK
ncbi:MAG: hypothetical protein V1853_01540 [bacterium]